MWDLLRGGAALKRPRAVDLSQRLSEHLVGGVGQPGHRDLLFNVLDLDQARRDLVFGLMAGEAGRRQFPGRPARARRAEALDLAASGRPVLVDALWGALTLGDWSDPHPAAFPADGPWRGEVHRLADRPAALTRSRKRRPPASSRRSSSRAAAQPGGPHDLQPPRLDPAGRAGEWLAAQEAAAVRDAIRYAQAHFHAVFVIRPTHNALLPLDLDGADDRARIVRRCRPSW